MSKMILIEEAKVQQALEALKREYSGNAQTSNAITALYEALAQPEQEPTIPDNSQNWKGMSGTDVWVLINRHADGWPDVGKMMGEWLAANQALAAPQPEHDVNLHFMKQVLGVAIGGLCEQYKDDALRVFTIEQLEKVVDYTEPLRLQRVEDVYKKAWDMLHTAPPAQLQPEWQPIETAPKDGSSYLVADAVRGFVAPHIRGVIHNSPGTSWDWQYGEEATHWMPLPAAPAQRQPLTKEQCLNLEVHPMMTIEQVVRVVEAAHGITGEKT